MQTRTLCATTVLFAALPAISLAQMTPVSGSRGISMSARVGSGSVMSYYNSAAGDIQLFNDSHAVGSSAQAQAWIESNLTPTLWVIDGSAFANAQFAPEGSFASAEAFANLSFQVEAGTQLHVTCRSGGSYGGMNSIVQVNGAGLNILITGGQNSQYASDSVFVTELSTVSLYARGHGYSSPGPLFRQGWFEVTISATAPAPGACGLLAAAALFASRRRRCETL